MIGLIGEYDCKVDAKGRFMFPSELKKQMGKEFDDGFVVTRNLHQPCLVVYPKAEWARLNKKLSRLNRLIKANDIFVRKVTGGATPVEPDGAGRILIPKSLADHASIQQDIKVVGSNNLIEIWDKNKYLDFMNSEVDIEKLANDVMGSIDFSDDES
ncbi:MAG: division/cell wall cluster transcriptional repressor MraZ [Bacteroidia bacterium]|nr:division/cell wall cluster transcriptional repressor MraZ [Bacteroidia bacterium]